jgi:phage shock protein A
MGREHAMDDTDLSNLDPQEARQYVLAFLATLKQTTRQREQTAQDLETWRTRLGLAQRSGAADLAGKAAMMVTQLEGKLAGLEAEESDLKRTVDTLKDNLRHLEITGRRLVDTDLLQAELDMAVGEDKAAEIKTDEALKDAQAQAALEELKKKLGGGA